MSLALLEDLIAVADVADLADVGPLLAWLDGAGLLRTERLAECRWCRAPFAKSTGWHPHYYCSPRCAKEASRRRLRADGRGWAATRRAA